MPLYKSFGLAVLAAVCLLGETAGSAHAQCSSSSNVCATEWSGGSVINLGGESTGSVASGVNNAGQAVGQSDGDAVIWSGGNVTNLGPGELSGINNAGQAVGIIDGNAAEWSAGKIINLEGLPGSTLSWPLAINDAGQVVGYSVVAGVETATEWSAGSVINLGGLPGYTFSYAMSINDAGQVAGTSSGGSGPGFEHPTEWIDGNAISLSTAYGYASGINDAGQVVGEGPGGAVEWSGGNVIVLGGSAATAINDAGQVVGYRFDNEGWSDAIEWSGGKVIDLGRLGSSSDGYPAAINDMGQVVGYSTGTDTVPESSTWAMMLLGFAGLGLVSYRLRST